MRFEKVLPCEQLRPYIQYLVISENEGENQYKVFPTAGMVIGLQYSGKLSFVEDNREEALASAGITGVMDRYRVFRNSPGIGTILIYFTETGLSHFMSGPAQELFNLSVSLEDVFARENVKEVCERLCQAATDHQRIMVVERFLISQLKERQKDKLILEAVRLIYASGGTIRISELNARLNISQSPFEKRFRRLVGTGPKKFASVVRFNKVLEGLGQGRSLTQLCYEHDFFDQAHFIKDFKRFTGETPEAFGKQQ